ncbi:hypothetical protein Pan110_60500 [Gimesia panareensis]|nr:hypothetical protein Pan110_60500 [Gimesia panareensis]
MYRISDSKFVKLRATTQGRPYRGSGLYHLFSGADLMNHEKH